MCVGSRRLEWRKRDPRIRIGRALTRIVAPDHHGWLDRLRYGSRPARPADEYGWIRRDDLGGSRGMEWTGSTACGIQAAQERPRSRMLPIVGEGLDHPPARNLVRLLLVRRQRFVVGCVRARVRRVIHGAPGALS